MRVGSRCDPHAEERVIDWLLTSEVQIRSGRYAGGVAGWLNGDSSSHFAYGEITGYYLTCLAGLARQSDAYHVACLPRIDRALRFLKRYWVEEPHPLTRAYVEGGSERDWRNGCHFSFDLAMMLRGAGAAAPYADPDLAGAVQGELAGRLERFASEPPGLLPCVQLRAGAVPERWSTAPGPYQVKTAAAILLQNGKVSDRLHAAAEETVRRWSSFVPAGKTAGHPFLYFIEGLLIAGTVRGDESLLKHCARVFRNEFEGTATGASAARFERSDVVAQTLRAGCALRRMGLLADDCWPEFFETLRAALAAFVTEAGAVRFRQPTADEPEYRNAWCAMIASQALEQYAACAEGRPFDPSFVTVLV